jgi:hypothetical protein
MVYPFFGKGERRTVATNLNCWEVEPELATWANNRWHKLTQGSSLTKRSVQSVGLRSYTG